MALYRLFQAGFEEALFSFDGVECIRPVLDMYPAKVWNIRVGTYWLLRSVNRKVMYCYQLDVGEGIVVESKASYAELPLVLLEERVLGPR